MNKAQLIEALADRLGDKKTAGEAVDGLVDIIVRTVNKNDKVNITGFGVFEKRPRAARTARNPRTGETVKVKKTNVPAFRPGSTFKDVISGAKKLPKATPVKRTTATAARTTTRATTTRATTTRATGTRATTTRATTGTRTRSTTAPATRATATPAPAKPKAASAAKPKAAKSSAKKSGKKGKK